MPAGPASWPSGAFVSCRFIVARRTRPPRRFGRTGTATRICLEITAIGEPSSTAARRHCSRTSSNMACWTTRSSSARPSSDANRRLKAAPAKAATHNAGAFTAWLAGGGIRGGVGYGATDELGFQAAEDPAYSYDLHATALHLLGIDHTRLTYYHNGIERRLTDVHGHVIKPILG